MKKSTNPIINFLTAPFRLHTYLNIFYLFLSFVLGVFYFVFFVTGFAVGVPLLFILVGFLILLFVFAGWWIFALFERQQAIWLLREDVPPMQKRSMAGMSLGDQFLALLSNPVTWKSLVFLFFKFPLGIINFVVATVLLALSATLLAAPFVYWFTPYTVYITWNWQWQVDTFSEAILLFLIGIPVLWLSINLLNGLAWVNGKFARLMLGDPSAVSPTVPPPPPPALVVPPPAPLVSELSEPAVPAAAVFDVEPPAMSVEAEPEPLPDVQLVELEPPAGEPERAEEPPASPDPQPEETIVVAPGSLGEEPAPDEPGFETATFQWPESTSMDEDPFFTPPPPAPESQEPEEGEEKQTP